MKNRMLLVSALVLMMSTLGYCNYPGDNNGDLACDDLDFLRVINNFGSSDPEKKLIGDCNGDGVTNDLDFLQVINNFGNKIEMVYIPAGDFQMGNSGEGEDYYADLQFSLSWEKPQHMVTLSGYWIGVYEVTRGEYRQFMNAGGYTNSAYWSIAGWSWKGIKTEPKFWADAQNWGTSFTQTDSHPVLGVTYYEAEAYCNWAGGHLPTEAQWEKAARWDGHPRIYPWGDIWNVYKCNNFYDVVYPSNQTTLVGSYASGASPSGCMDMAGNVREWCQDWYKSYPDSSNPFDNTGINRVLRGDGWTTTYVYDLRAAARKYSSPSGFGNDYGFRLAR